MRYFYIRDNDGEYGYIAIQDEYSVYMKNMTIIKEITKKEYEEERVTNEDISRI